MSTAVPAGEFSFVEESYKILSSSFCIKLSPLLLRVLRAFAVKSPDDTTGIDINCQLSADTKNPAIAGWGRKISGCIY